MSEKINYNVTDRDFVLHGADREDAAEAIRQFVGDRDSAKLDDVGVFQKNEKGDITGTLFTRKDPLAITIESEGTLQAQSKDINNTNEHDNLGYEVLEQMKRQGLI